MQARGLPAAVGREGGHARGRQRVYTAPTVVVVEEKEEEEEEEEGGRLRKTMLGKSVNHVIS